MAIRPSQADIRALLDKEVPQLIAADGERFANTKRQQEERAARLRAQQAAQAQSSNYAAERASAGVQQALSQARAQLDHDMKLRTLRDRQKGKLQRSATEPPLERKPSKLAKVVGGLFAGLEIKARSWEAPSEELLSLQRAKEELQRKQYKDAEDMRKLENLVKEIGLGSSNLAGLPTGGNDKRATAEDLQKRLQALRAGKKNGEEEVSLADQQKLARTEWEAQRLTIIKLELAQREEQRKELAAMQEKLKSMGLPARIVTDLHEEHQDIPHGDGDYGLFHEDDDLFGDSGFGQDSRAAYMQQQQRQGFPGVPTRATTMDGRSRGASNQAFEQPMFSSAEDLFGEPISDLDHGASLFPGQTRRQEPALFGTADPSFFGEDVPLRRGTTGSFPRQDTRQQLRRNQTLPAYATANFPTSSSDPRLNRRDPRYDRKFAEAFADRREAEQRRADDEKLRHMAMNRQPGSDQQRREAQEKQRYLAERQKAAAQGSRMHADDAAEVAQLKAEQEASDKRERLLAQQEELARLEKMLQDHPEARIKGLDERKLLNDPRLLEEALRQVAANIERGVSPLVHKNSSQPARGPAPLISDNMRLHVTHFLQQEHLEQQHLLDQLRNDQERRNFLQATLSIAPPDYAHQVYDRFGHAGYELEMPTGYRPRAGPRRAPVPDIVIDRVRSPPPTQDLGPHIIERFVDEEPAQQVRQQQDTGKKNKGKGKQQGQSAPQRNIPPADIQSSVVVEEPIPPSAFSLPSPPRTSPPRTSAGHPSGQADYRAEAALDEEAAEIEREKREIAELEARIAAETARKEQEERAEMEARAAAAAEEESRRARDRPVLPPPPSPFVANSPPRARVASPARSTIISPRASMPMPDVGATNTDNDTWGSPAKADMDTWGQPTSPRVDAAWGADAEEKADPLGSWGDDEPVIQATSPKSVAGSQKAGWKTPTPANTPKARSPSGSKAVTPVASKQGTPVASKQATPVASKAASPIVSKAASLIASRIASPAQSPGTASAKALSIITSPAVHKEPTSANSPVVAAAVTSPKAASIKEASSRFSPAAGSVKSASKRSSRVTSPVVTSPKTAMDEPTTIAEEDSWAIPVSDDPEVIAEAIKSPSKASSRAPSVKAPTAPSTPKAATPAVSRHTTPKASIAGSPAKSAAAAGSAWGSPPAPAPTAEVKSPEAATVPQAWGSPAKSNRSVHSASKPQSPVTSAWGATSPPQRASPAVSTKGDSWPAEDAAQAASPAKSSKSVKSPTKPTSPITAEAWRASSPAAAVASPVKSVKGDTWGATSPAQEQTNSPHAASAASPAKEAASRMASPKQSLAKEADTWGASSPVKASPAFGLAVSPKAGGDGWAGNEEHQKTATKGSDPVVVSLAAVAATPVQEHMSEHDGEHHDDGGEHFDPEQFPVYMEGEPLEPGLELVMDPPAQAFGHVFARTGPGVNEDSVIDQMAYIAHQQGYDAIFQCATSDQEDGVHIRGYFIHTQHAVHDPAAESSAQWAVDSPPAAAAGKKTSPSKQATVRESSEAGCRNDFSGALSYCSFQM